MASAWVILGKKIVITGRSDPSLAWPDHYCLQGILPLKTGDKRPVKIAVWPREISQARSDCVWLASLDNHGKGKFVVKNLCTPMYGACRLIRALGIRGTYFMQSISSLSSLHGSSGAWMSVTMLYFRKKNNKKLKLQGYNAMGHKAAFCNNPFTCDCSCHICEHINDLIMLYNFVT